MPSTGYGDSSIRALKGAERVRKRPGVMFGSDTVEGAFHTFKEILGNATDEVKAGACDKIQVIYHRDGSITVIDNGRGVPMAWNEEEKEWNWHLIFNDLYAGGKYDENESNGYDGSIGTNGLGAAAVQYTSEFFHVESCYGGKLYIKDFEKGSPVGELQVMDAGDHPVGTLIHWKIDNEVFQETAFEITRFTEYCEMQAHVNRVTIDLLDEATSDYWSYEGQGVEYYLRSKLGDSVVDTFSRNSQANGYERNKPYRAKCEIVLAITKETHSQQLYFHNTSPVRGGVHAEAIQLAVVHFFRDVGRQNGVNIIEYDYQDYLSCAISTSSNLTAFSNQTKESVNNRFLFELIYKTVGDMLAEAIAMNKSSVSDMVQNVVGAALARKKAKEIEQQERMLRKSMNSRKKAEKLADCSSKDPAERELYIVEGDSALGSVKTARNGRFQAVIPVRGKTINCLKAPIDVILKSDIVRDILSTIGTGADVEGIELFDISGLQYNKIIICTDADVDGYQIRVLLYTMFYRLMPQLLRDGYVFVAETPLFELETSEGIKFAYTLAERDSIIEELKSRGGYVNKISRSKGLGENDPDMMKLTTMDPETRRLVPLEIDPNNDYVRAVSNMLFGNDPGNERKGFIFDMLEEGLLDVLDTTVGLENMEMSLREEVTD